MAQAGSDWVRPVYQKRGEEDEENDDAPAAPPRKLKNQEVSDRNSTSDDEKRPAKKSKQDGGERKVESTPAKNAEEVMALTTRTGGAYIPPARLRAMQAQITDKSSVAYQRIAWEALKKSIHGMINKVNVGNLSQVVQEIFRENIVRARGLFAKSCIDAQSQSPTFTHVYAALVAVVNTKFPQIGELILKRLITTFRKAYARKQKALCLSSAKFIAHLVNQQVADELIALEILTLLLDNQTNDSVELAIGFLKECGLKLQQTTPKGLNAIFDQLRTISQESQLDNRVHYMVPVIYAVRKENFKDYPSILPELDLVEEEDQFTHPLTLEEQHNPEAILNVFQFDPDFEVNEEKYKVIRRDILGEDEGESGDEGSGEDDDEDEKETAPSGAEVIVDSTETNLVALRKTIYLTVQSSLGFEECCHKLLRIELKPGQESEVCHMILDCCAQQRTYEKFYGLLGQRFCQLKQEYVEPFQKIFVDSYDTIHRLETNKLRNVAKFFGHLLHTDAISWLVMGHIKLNEEDTTSSSRIFIKILFHELAEFMGMPNLLARIRDPSLQEAFEGLFPRDNPKNTRFAVNFFTSIGLGGLTDDLREHLVSAPKAVAPPVDIPSESSSSSSSDSDSDSSESASSREPSPDRRKTKLTFTVRGSPQRRSSPVRRSRRESHSPPPRREEHRRQKSPSSPKRKSNRDARDTPKRRSSANRDHSLRRKSSRDRDDTRGQYRGEDDRRRSGS